MKLLKGERNRYDGMQVDTQALPESAEVFAARLAASIDEWRRTGIKLVWLRLPSSHAALIAPALAQGFQFHHCRSAEVTLIRRLAADAYLPAASTHSIGAGAVVLNDRRELLTVLERGDAVARPHNVKLPGGMLERGENMADGVIREVFEETGVRTEFQGLISFRHHHRGQFGESNIYAVCRLKPLTYEIHIDEVEIAQAMWIPVDQYLAREGIGLYNRCVVQAALAAPPMASIKLDGYMDGPDDYEIFVTAPS
jgi:8-oxo-dGTP pyrophosphatase MutT (NUDIX family)